MDKTLIDYNKTGFFSSIMKDYLGQHPELSNFYRLSPSLSAFKKVIEEREYQNEHREVLVHALREQYKKGGIAFSKDDSVERNINSLLSDNTFTITTGHQLCLFTGPLYFIYKIFSIINLTETLNKEFPNQRFVPIYWMATEDHDFDEINHFNLFGNRVEWEQKEKGAVGRMNTSSLKSIVDSLANILGDREEGKKLIELFEHAYLKNLSLADATRTLVHNLFSQYGLVCLDADDQSLKSTFADHMETDLFRNLAYREVTKTNAKLEEKYKIQVNPREINLFYLEDGLRERIVRNEESDTFSLADGSKSFSRSEIAELLSTHPERFSPNVIMRPLYQECILPNLAYIGGGGELAYWLQLKSFFDESKVPFPLLILRNSALWVDNGSSKKMMKNDVEITSIFEPLENLLEEYAKKNAAVELELDEEKKQLEEWYTQLVDKSKAVDPGIGSYLMAEQKKSTNMLNDLEKRLIRAEKKNNETAIAQIESVKHKLFPNAQLQERHNNFAELYLQHGEQFFHLLKQELDPLVGKFIVFSPEVN